MNANTNETNAVSDAAKSSSCHCANNRGVVMSKWIGPFYVDNIPSVGDRAFLIEISNPIARRERYELRQTPAQTNQSYEPKLSGWCGSWNDVSTYAKGCVRVAKVAANGRVLVVPIDGDELAEFLENAGYPELIEGVQHDYRK